MPAASSLRAAAAGALAFFVATVVVQHALAPELDPAQYTVSEYANADAGALMTVGFVAWAVALLLTSALFRRHLRVLALLFGVAAAGALVTAAFRTQAVAASVPPDVARTTAGRLHDVGSGAAILAVLAAALITMRVFSRPGWFRPLAATLLVAALVTDIVLLAVGDPAPGLRQRVLLGVGCAWHAGMLAAVTAPATSRACRA